WQLLSRVSGKRDSASPPTDCCSRRRPRSRYTGPRLILERAVKTAICTVAHEESRPERARARSACRDCAVRQLAKRSTGRRSDVPGWGRKGRGFEETGGGRPGLVARPPPQPAALDLVRTAPECVPSPGAWREPARAAYCRGRGVLQGRRHRAAVCQG